MMKHTFSISMIALAALSLPLSACSNNTSATETPVATQTATSSGSPSMAGEGVDPYASETPSVAPSFDGVAHLEGVAVPLPRQTEVMYTQLSDGRDGEPVSVKNSYSAEGKVFSMPKGTPRKTACAKGMSLFTKAVPDVSAPSDTMLNVYTCRVSLDGKIVYANAVNSKSGPVVVSVVRQNESDMVLFYRGFANTVAKNALNA